MGSAGLASACPDSVETEELAGLAFVAGPAELVEIAPRPAEVVLAGPVLAAVRTEPVECVLPQLSEHALLQPAESAPLQLSEFVPPRPAVFVPEHEQALS